MYRGLKTIVIIPCFNEEKKIGRVVSRVKATSLADEILVVDDGSTDDSARIAEVGGATVLSLGRRHGVGAALRAGFEWGAKLFDVIIVMAGNDKDEPREISRLLDPIVDKNIIFVQGSRFLGSYGGDMPLHRKIATRLHPILFTLATGKKVTESTNGFRAFRVDLLADPRIQLAQSWLDRYELEPYLYYKTITLGHACTEVPVSKFYPSLGLGYTKMKPFSDWWSILRPLVLLRLGWRQ